MTGVYVTKRNERTSGNCVLFGRVRVRLVRGLTEQTTGLRSTQYPPLFVLSTPPFRTKPSFVHTKMQQSHIWFGIDPLTSISHKRGTAPNPWQGGAALFNQDTEGPEMTSSDHSFSDEFRKRFWARVDVGPPDACWDWQRGRDHYGYGDAGRFIARQEHRVVTRKAHRLAWELTHGPIQHDLLVCHSCDRPPCCNPSHLWLGTCADNNRDMQDKGRGASGDRHGSHTKPETWRRGDQHHSRLYPEKLARGDRHGSRTKPETTVRGEQQHCAKLTETQVREIRDATGTQSQRATAVRYGVSRSLISAIRLRKIWKHIT